MGEPSDFQAGLRSLRSALVKLQHHPDHDSSGWMKWGKIRRNRETYGESSLVWASYAGAIGLVRRLWPRWVLPMLDACRARLSAMKSNGCNECVAKALKCVSDTCSTRIGASGSVAWGALVGINSAGAPFSEAGWNAVDATRDWVSGKARLCSRPALMEWMKAWVDNFVWHWARQPAPLGETISYEEFLDDPFKWATSGSGPPVVASGGKVRNKWAWAAETISTYGSISNWYKQKGTAAAHNTRNVVALKQEPGKTRLVIAAPICSYLRQCYIYYRLGKPKHLRSTLTDEHITEKLERGWGKLAAIDASKFDHNVPPEFIKQVFESIARWVPELAGIARTEWDNISSSYCEVNGERVKYEKGILSGWRFTSLLDSMLSQMVVEYLNLRTSATADWIVQGDDTIMWDGGLASKEVILDLLDELGLDVNVPKSNFGVEGEFLKYVYTRKGIFGYPARALHGIFYGNPWLAQSLVTSPAQIANQWNTLRSRLLPFVGYDATVRGMQFCSADIARWARTATKQQWLDYLRTPANVGGGGWVEDCVTEDSPLWGRTILEGVALGRPYQLANGRANEVLEAFNIKDTPSTDSYRTTMKIVRLDSQLLRIRPFTPKEFLFGAINQPGRNIAKAILDLVGVRNQLQGTPFDWKLVHYPNWVNTDLERVKFVLEGGVKFSPPPALTASSAALSRALRYCTESMQRWCYSRRHIPSRGRIVSAGLYLFRECLRVSSPLHTA